MHETHIGAKRTFSEPELAEPDLRVRTQDIGASCQKSSPMGKAAKIYTKLRFLILMNSFFRLLATVHSSGTKMPAPRRPRARARAVMALVIIVTLAWAGLLVLLPLLRPCQNRLIARAARP
jgi:hypothetical protein